MVKISPMLWFLSRCTFARPALSKQSSSAIFYSMTRAGAYQTRGVAGSVGYIVEPFWVPSPFCVKEGLQAWRYLVTPEPIQARAVLLQVSAEISNQQGVGTPQRSVCGIHGASQADT